MASALFLSVVTLLLLASSMSHATETFQEYWSRMLPNTPMPSAIRNHLGEEKVDDAINSEKSSEEKSNVGVVSGVDGKHVSIDVGSKPRTLVYYSKKDGEVINIDKNSKKDDKEEKSNAVVISGINGKPVAINMGSKPKPYLDYSKKASTDSIGLNGEVENSVSDFIDTPGASSFFLQKDLHRGAKMRMLFKRTVIGDNFLHREVAKTIPFSSDKIAEIFRRFSVQPGSPVAERMESTIRHCELPPAPGEKKLCSTSFEDMIDFVTSSLDTNNLLPLTTVVGKDAPNQVYTVQSWSIMPSPNWAATICHIGSYPYTIFQCHSVPLSAPYMVKLVGEDGTVVNSAAACHLDTSTRSSTYYVIKELKVTPGKVSICHLLLEGEVLWIPRTDHKLVAAA